MSIAVRHWLYLALAIGFEVCGTLSMRLSNGFQNLRWSAAMVLLYLVCFGFLAMAVKVIPVSAAYAIWSGLGTALVVLVGIVQFHESAHPLKLLSIALIVVGVVGLRLVGSEH